LIEKYKGSGGIPARRLGHFVITDHQLQVSSKMTKVYLMNNLVEKVWNVDYLNSMPAYNPLPDALSRSGFPVSVQKRLLVKILRAIDTGMQIHGS
jgi:hypothetical protein